MLTHVLRILIDEVMKCLYALLGGRLDGELPAKADFMDCPATGIEVAQHGRRQRRADIIHDNRITRMRGTMVWRTIGMRGDACSRPFLGGLEEGEQPGLDEPQAFVNQIEGDVQVHESSEQASIRERLVDE